MTGNGSVDKVVVKCLRVEEKSFVARNKMSGSSKLLWYGISHTGISILTVSFFPVVQLKKAEKKEKSGKLKNPGV